MCYSAPMIEKGTVQKLAALARIRVSEENSTAFETEFDSVLTYIGQLDSLELSTAGTSVAGTLRNVVREDGIPTPPGTWTERIVRAFPKKSGNALSVKKIISHD